MLEGGHRSDLLAYPLDHLLGQLLHRTLDARFEHHQTQGQLPLGLVVLKSGVERPAQELAGEMVQRVREQIGPVAAFKHISIVKRLPKTRSGKILRSTMVKIADGSEWRMPATIDDPAILDEITSSLQTIGYAKA
jgi:propionyl-CoA synthetase